MSHAIQPPGIAISSKMLNLLDGRWRSPLFTFLSHTKGRSEPTMHDVVTWMNGLTRERHDIPLHRIRELRRGGDSMKAFAQFRTAIELHLLLSSHGLLQSAEEQTGHLELTKKSNRMCLCGANAIRSLKKREDVRIKILPRCRELYGMPIAQLIPAEGVGGPDSSGIYLFFEPLFSGTGYSNSIIEFDARLTLLRYRPADPNGAMIEVGGAGYETSLCLESKGPVLQWETGA
jgi:hypothetical protein